MSICYLAFVAGRGMEGHVVVKIGHTKNPDSRFQCLIAQSWVGPSVFETTPPTLGVKGVEVEQFMHQHLRKYAVHHEWFHVPAEALDDAKDAVQKRFGVAFSLYDIDDFDASASIDEAYFRQFHSQQKEQAA